MVNNLNLPEINLLTGEYIFYDNSIEHFDLDFPSTISDENIDFLDNINIDSNNVLKKKYEQIKEKYSKYNSDLAIKIYINKVRSINFYFIDETEIKELLKVDKISIKVISIDEPIIEKTITLILNEKIIFNIIFEINEIKKHIVVKKTHIKQKNPTESIIKSDCTKNIEINSDTFTILEKINYDPSVITKNLESIKEIVKNITKEDIQNIVKKNLIYEIKSKEQNNNKKKKDIFNQTKKLIEINFVKESYLEKEIKIKDPQSQNNNINNFGEIKEFGNNEYIFNFFPNSIEKINFFQKNNFVKSYIKKYFDFHLKLYEYMKKNFFSIISDIKNDTLTKKLYVEKYLGKYFNPVLDVRFENKYELYLDNKKIGYFNKGIFKFFNNQTTLNKIQNQLNKLKIRNESSQYIKNIDNVVVMKHNIMIITYNEQAKKFNDNDVRLLIKYINDRNPLIIVVNTQESASLIGNGSFVGEASHFQHILKNNLENNEYKLVGKEDASVSLGYNPIKSNKNVRLRIYVKKDINILNNPTSITYNDKSNNNIIKIGRNKGLYFNDRFTKDRKIQMLKSLDQYSPLQIINKKKNIKKSKQFGKLLNGTIWKGSIYFPLYLQKNNKIKKFIFVNSHLYFSRDKYGKRKNTGLERRKKMFIDLIKEFKLDEKYKEGYNIFFIGDLNFRLTVINENEYLFNKNPANKDNKNPNSNEKFIKEYIEKTVKAYMKKDNDTLYKKDEIYNFLKKEINSSNGNMKNLLNKFKESIEKSKTFLTYKYRTDLKNNNKKSIEEIVNNIDLNTIKYNTDVKKIFETENYTTITNFGKKSTKKNNDLATIIEPPSNPDRILYALHNINIKKEDLKMFMVPTKSDHKLITLNFDLEFN